MADTTPAPAPAHVHSDACHHDHGGGQPQRRIFSSEDLAEFVQSEAHATFVQFIEDLSAAVTGLPNQANVPESEVTLRGRPPPNAAARRCAERERRGGYQCAALADRRCVAWSNC